MSVRLPFNFILPPFLWRYLNSGPLVLDRSHTAANWSRLVLPGTRLLVELGNGEDDTYTFSNEKLPKQMGTCLDGFLGNSTKPSG